MAPHARRILLAVAASWGVLVPALAPAAAMEYRAVAENAAILYDGPTTRSTKLYVVNRGYPLEVVVAIEGWVKVRDAAGAFAWIEAKQLTDKRMVMVKVPLADVRTKPEDSAPVAFQAQENVLLDVVAVNAGWVEVRHPDGGAGFVRAQQVWGA
jgi:SH3-like domain-containing protein